MKRQDRLRNSLGHLGLTLPIDLFTLGCAVWRLPPQADSHAFYLAQLPGFVQAERKPRAETSQFRALKRHLLICSECAKIYLELLELAEQHRDATTSPLARTPTPVLSFLEQSDE